MEKAVRSSACSTRRWKSSKPQQRNELRPSATGIWAVKFFDKNMVGTWLELGTYNLSMPDFLKNMVGTYNLSMPVIWVWINTY